MTEVEQLENRIASLSSEDLARFRAWFVDFEARRSNPQTDPNASGRDDLVGESLADYGSGEARSEAAPPDTLQGAVRRIAAQKN